MTKEEYFMNFTKEQLAEMLAERDKEKENKENDSK